MADPQDVFKAFSKKHDFLVAISSDGCAFDTMEIKHKECFIPNIIKYWKLQAVSKYTRAAAEFVNLYSKWRGINRFPALIMVFDLLKDWQDVQRRNVEIPVAQAIRDWIARETKLANPVLQAEVERSGEPILKQALAWSEAVNKSIADMVKGVPPFPKVRESLEKLAERADIIVCSATSNEALRREWEEHGIAQYTRIIAGQELGSKKEHIQHVAQNRYDAARILMVGHAPGDMKAAHANNALFYPIIPRQEEESWQKFYSEVIALFLTGKYTREIEKQFIDEFEIYLPEIPPWKSSRRSFKKK